MIDNNNKFIDFLLLVTDSVIIVLSSRIILIDIDIQHLKLYNLESTTFTTLVL